MASAEFEGCHFAGPWLIICASPDECKTPVGGTPVPVAYQSIAFGTNAVDTSSSVLFKNTGAFHSPSTTVCCFNNEPGVLGGVVSGVNMGACYELTHSTTVLAQSQPVIRNYDMAVMNARDRKSPGNAVGFFKYVAASVFVEFVEALGEGTEACVKILETVDPRFGPALRTPPEPLDRETLKKFTRGMAGGGLSGVKANVSRRAIGLPAQTANTAGLYEKYMDLIGEGKHAEALGLLVGNIGIRAALSKVTISKNKGKSKPKRNTRKSKKDHAKAKRKQQRKSRRNNRKAKKRKRRRR